MNHRWLSGTLVIAMALHGLYDFFLLALNATYMAGAIALVLWIFLIVHTRKLALARKRKRLRGGA